MSTHRIRELQAPEARERAHELAEILLDCVAGGASVGFMASTSPEQALAFWQRVAAGMAAAERHLLVAEDDAGRLAGTVSLLTDMPPNQPHRGDIAKMLVHRRARRQGLAGALMQAAQDLAAARGLTLLVLDTVTGSEASRVYERAGWQRCGDIPGYALFPDGRPCSTTYYFKALDARKPDGSR